MKSRFESLFLAAAPVFLWSGYGHDAQHTALSTVAAQARNGIHWSTPVDLKPQTTSGELLIHYGSPAVTAANTVLLPVMTGVTEGFEIEARNGATGALIYSLASDYTLPPHNWTPPYGIVLSSPANGGTPDRENRPREPGRGAREPKVAERLYYPGAGGPFITATRWIRQRARQAGSLSMAMPCMPRIRRVSTAMFRFRPR